MSRRKGQNPKVLVGKRSNGEKYFFFQYWIDVPALTGKIKYWAGLTGGRSYIS